jgi:hypothetical protein
MKAKDNLLLTLTPSKNFDQDRKLNKKSAVSQTDWSAPETAEA